MSTIVLAAALLFSAAALPPQVQNISVKGESIGLISASPRNPLLSLIRGSDGRLLRSGDAGATYQESPDASIGFVLGMGWDSTGFAYVADNSPTLFVSSDGAQSWVERQFPGPGYQAFAVNPSQSEELWFVDDTRTVFRSQNAGRTWSSGLFTAPQTVRGIELVPEDPDRVGVFTDGTLNITLDRGATWNPVSLPNSDQGFVVKARDIEFLGDRIIHLGLLDFNFGSFEDLLSVSDDGGATWTKTYGLVYFAESSTTNLRTERREPGTVYLGSNGGFFRSEDSGTTWEHQGGFPRPFGFAIPGGGSDRLLLGTAQGVIRFDSDGLPYRLASGDFGDLQSTQVVIDPLDHDHLVDFNRLESFDGGQSWGHLPHPSPTDFLSFSVLRTPARGGIYIGGPGIWRLEDSQWISVANPVPSAFVLDFHFGELDPDLIVVLSGTSEPQLSLSPDGGQSWSTQSICLNGPAGQDCSFDVDEFEVIEQDGCPPRITFVVDGDGLFYTDDGGASLVSVDTDGDSFTARGRRNTSEMVLASEFSSPLFVSTDALETLTPSGVSSTIDRIIVGSGINGALIRFRPFSNLLQLSTDVGNTWSDIEGLPNFAGLREISVAINDHEALITGQWGIRLVTLTPTISETTCVPPVTNSIGVDASLAVRGSRSISANDVRLDIENLPRFAPCLFLGSFTSGFVNSTGGSMGDLCLGGAIGRFPTLGFSGASGAASIDLDPLALAQPAGAIAATAGQAWFFQAWYRDAVGGLPTSNLSNAVEMVWEP